MLLTGRMVSVMAPRGLRAVADCWLGVFDMVVVAVLLVGDKAGVAVKLFGEPLEVVFEVVCRMGGAAAVDIAQAGRS